LLRLPIWLYRLHLGWILGDRFLMFRHVGRITGLPRYTVVEVVQHNPATDTYTIASGWGEKADWLRNIRQQPEVVLYSGHRRMAARAVRLPVADAAERLLDYAGRHPLAFRKLSRLMVGQEMSGSEADCRTLAQAVPLVGLIPQP